MGTDQFNSFQARFGRSPSSWSPGPSVISLSRNSTRHGNGTLDPPLLLTQSLWYASRWSPIYTPKPRKVLLRFRQDAWYSLAAPARMACSYTVFSAHSEKGRVNSWKASRHASAALQLDVWGAEMSAYYLASLSFGLVVYSSDEPLLSWISLLPYAPLFIYGRSCANVCDNRILYRLAHTALEEDNSLNTSRLYSDTFQLEISQIENVCQPYHCAINPPGFLACTWAKAGQKKP